MHKIYRVYNKRISCYHLRQRDGNETATRLTFEGVFPGVGTKPFAGDTDASPAVIWLLERMGT